MTRRQKTRSEIERCREKENRETLRNIDYKRTKSEMERYRMTGRGRGRGLLEGI